MNIAIIKRKYMAKGGGGAENYARYIVNGLIEKGHKIFILAKQFEAKQTENLHHIPVKMNKMLASSGTTAFHKGAQKILPKAIKEYNIDVTYALSRTFPVDVFRVTEQVHIEWMNLNYPSYQKLNPRHKGILNLERNIFNTKNCKAAVTNSKLSKELIIKHYGFPSENIHIISNGINMQFYDSPKANKNELRTELIPSNLSEKFILLFVATNFEIKGLEQAIAATARLPQKIKKNTLLLILGGDNPDKYKKQAEGLGILDNIYFAGTANDVKSYYYLSDILVYPSLGEPFGNVCLEASASGLPVITTRQNGSCEVVTHNKNGYILDSPNNIDQITDSIAAFYQLAQKSKQDICEQAVKATLKYRWDSHLENLEKLLSTISANK